MKKYGYSEDYDAITNIDVDAGLRVSVGSFANYKKALFAGLKSIRGKLPIIFSMIDYKEYDGFVTIAGTLSRICKSIGAGAIAADIDTLQVYALNGNAAVLETELPKLGRELEKLLTDLEELLRIMDRMEKGGEIGIFDRSPLHSFLKENYKAI